MSHYACKITLDFVQVRYCYFKILEIAVLFWTQCKTTRILVRV